jgi:hypothetical protein
VLERFATPRRRTRLAGARTVLLAELERPPGDASAATALAKLSGSAQLELVGGLRDVLSGGQAERLGGAAQRTGLLEQGARLCRSRRWRRRLRGARVLTLLGAGHPVGRSLLVDARPEVRAQGAEWAAAHPSPEIVDRLLEMLGDEQRLCRFAVTDALLRLGPLAVERLSVHLGERSGPAAEPALRVAAWRADPRMLQPALVLCTDPWAPTRARAADLAGALGGERAVARLEELLGDPDAGVRAAAARGLGTAAHWPAASALAACLGDPGYDVRHEAALALRGLGGAGMLMLRRALRAPDAYARDMARHVLDLPEGGVR